MQCGAANAIHQLSISGGEAVPQLRFSLHPLQEVRTVQWWFSAFTVGHHLRLKELERRWAEAATIWTAINLLAAHDPLGSLALSGILWALKDGMVRDVCSMHRSTAVCWSDSTAARWEHRIDAYFRLANVRAITSSYTHAHP